MSMEVSRRSFLQAAGVGTASAALMAGSALADEATTAAADVPSFMIPPEPIPDEQISATYNHDIVVIGTGISGLCCAVSAAEQGADVIVFSAGTMPTGRGGSVHGIGTKYQAEMGIEDSVEARREQVLIDLMANQHKVDIRKWYRWMNNSAESMDWMIDKMAAKGLKCSLEMPYEDPDGVLSCPPASHNFWTDEQNMGVFQGAPLIAQAYADTFTNDLGGQIDYQTEALYLIRDDDNTGRVSAVVAKTADGSYVKYEANTAIVMATGDFSKDLDMIAYYSPETYRDFKDVITPEIDYDMQRINSGTMPGTGQKMGLWVGAAWQRVNPTPTMMATPVTGPRLCTASGMFWGINLAKDGRRFHNENTSMGYAGYTMLNIPGQAIYTVWDTDYAYIKDSWEITGCTYGNVNGYVPQTSEELIASWDAAVEKGTMFKADTLEGLLDQLEGIDKETALASIQHYSECAKAGYDDEFHVNPTLLHPIETGPFYGAVSPKSGIRFQGVPGGLLCNEFMQVCEEDNTPIEGLYNVGVMVGDFYCGVYNFAFPGQNLGACCTTFPYLLGRELAAK